MITQHDDEIIWCFFFPWRRWLFYFLARQKQAEAAIEAYKVVDKQALAQLSPTCLSELFRSLIDNEIITQVCAGLWGCMFCGG